MEMVCLQVLLNIIVDQSAIEPAHEIMVLITKATSEDSGEHAHPQSWSMEVDKKRNI